MTDGMSEMQEKDPERPQGAPPPAAEDPEQPASARLEDPPKDLKEGDTAPLRITHPPAAPNPFGGAGETAAPARTGAGNKTTQPAARTVVHPAAPSGAPPAERKPPPGGLPRPVSQTDPGATRVSPAAYQPPPQPPLRRPPVQKPAYPPAQPPAYPPVRRPPVQKPPASQWVAVPPRRRGCSWSLGCLGRTFFFGFFALALAALCVLSLMFYQYYRIAATLPDIEDLRERASQFETTRILDRNGALLYEILDPTAGRRTYVRLDKISPYMVAATIATEDKGFYSHPGFDAFAIARAFVQNFQGGEIVSGASTITQQLARNLLFTPEERSEQSYQRKMREAILAAEITRRYSKDEILELYLNEIYYGNLAYGVEAASETYFGATADKLDLAQASFLAGLPQAPAVYDVYTNPEATFSRQKDVLALMYQASQEQNCIYVSNSPQRVCIDPVSVAQAARQSQEFTFKSPDVQMRYPHWVNYIRAQLEALYDPQTIYRAGFSVYTTLDPQIQDLAQAALSEQVAGLRSQNVKSGALVAIQPGTGQILAMVGSADYYNEAISGQVNMAVSPRQPGSSIKPLTYLAAFEKGWTPATLIWDVPSEFPPSGIEGDPSPPYTPVNYDGTFHGPVTVRTALANSYNVPAVKTLQFVGIYDNPATPREDGLVPMARRLGISTLTRPDYGLSLTLGGGEVTLLELSGAYSVIANRGARLPLTAITKIVDFEGTVMFEQRQELGEQALRPEHAYLITSILSDNRARTPAFGPNSVLNLPFPVAVKTGTTNDFRDNWTIGFTPDLVVGVWVGNPDYTPMVNTTGLSGAAPIWAEVMQSAIGALTGGAPAPFTAPVGVVEQVICEVSGAQPSQWCPQQRTELFALDQPPLPADQDLWQKAALDTWTGLRASPACADFVRDRLVLNVTDQFARRWIRREPAGQVWAARMGFDPPVTFAPNRECRADDPRPLLDFAYPRDNNVIREGVLDVYIVANATQGFEFWELAFGYGENPLEWTPLAQGRDPLDQPELVYKWDLTD
ncbi:MAG: transglycosylase domain-containing protein, partial [Anaerolineae bacterium]|nr:transglycosylase domain-containing protein [Anaerolineae bacterium]